MTHLNNHLREYREKSIPRLIISLSVPAILANLVNLLYNLVDRIYVGRLGSEALGAITAALPYTTILVAFSALIGTGASAVISLKLGENEYTDAARVNSTSFFLLLMVSVVVMVPSLFLMDEILLLSGTNSTSAVTTAYARDYLFVIILGIPFQLVSAGMNQNIRAEGNARVAMYTSIAGTLTNIILDPLFIFGFGMEVRGAAIATILGQAVSAVWSVGYYLSRHSHLKLSLRRFDPSCILRILQLGLPQFLIQVASAAIILLYNNSLAIYGKAMDAERGGDVALAAFGIVTSLGMVLLTPLYGINQGTQPLLGYNYGAKDYARVRSILLISIFYGTVWMIVGFLAAELVPGLIIRIFNNSDPDLITFGSLALRITAIFMPLVGFQVLGSNYYMAIGNSRTSILLSASRQIVLFIPAIIVLPLLFPEGKQIYGVMWASPTADLLSALIAAGFVIHELKRLSRLARTVQPTTEVPDETH